MSAASDALVEGVAGAISACVAVAAFYPLLTVSTVKSVNTRGSSSTSSSSGGDGDQGALAVLLGPLRDVAAEARKLGLAGLFAGLKPAVVGTAISQGIYFTVYSRLRQAAVARKLAREGRTLQSAGGNSHAEGISMGASILVASTAGCINVLVTNPVWVVVTQLQAASRSEPGRGFWAAARQVWRESGWRGFFKGVLPSLVMVSNPTLQFFIYEYLVARWLALRRAGQARGKAAPLSMLDVFLLSAISKAGATILTYPMLLIKNRMQAATRQTEVDMQYAGVADAVRRIARTEGLPGFYRGLETKLVQTVLSAALLMALKEEIYTATRSALQLGGGGSAAPPSPVQPLRAARS